MRGPSERLGDIMGRLGLLPLADRGQRVVQRNKIWVAVGAFVAAIAVASMGLVYLPVALGCVAAVYVALTRLERKAFVSSRMVEPEGPRGHTRRYFRLTPAGLNALRASRRTFLSRWQRVEPLRDSR